MGQNSEIKVQAPIPSFARCVFNLVPRLTCAWLWCVPCETQQDMTFALRQPPLWWDRRGFAQFHAAQCFDLTFSFLLEQRLELKRKMTTGADGKRVDNKPLLLDAWREFLRRATSWPPPFFIMLVTVAEVALASLCEPNEHREDQRGSSRNVPSSLSRSHHWVSQSRPVSLRLLPSTSLRFQ